MERILKILEKYNVETVYINEDYFGKIRIAICSDDLILLEEIMEEFYNNNIKYTFYDDCLSDYYEVEVLIEK